MSNLFIREVLQVFEDQGQSQLWLQGGDRFFNLFFGFAAHIILLSVARFRSQVKQIIKRDQSPTLALLINAEVDDQSIKPGRKLRFVTKPLELRIQLEEDRLGHIMRRRRVAAEIVERGLDGG